MDTFLDLLILVVMVLAAVSLVAVLLMFLVKNRKVKQVCLYVIAALCVYLAYVGIRISWPGFLGQRLVAILVALVGIGAVVLERLGKGGKKGFLAAQTMASASLIVGLLNAFVA